MGSSAMKPKLSETTSHAANLAVLFAVTAICFFTLEIVLPRFDQRFVEFFHREPPEVAFNERRAAESLASSDPDLGWDRPPSGAVVGSEPYYAQAYGDSFTLSGHDGPTWEDLFARSTGRKILNLGVSAYGLDQAVLKFERDASKYSGELAILGLYGEMYRRSLSYHPYYYFVNADHYRYLFKPIFTRTADGFLLNRPPCRTLECLRRALFDRSSAAAKVREDHDFWYQRYASLPALEFPRLWSYVRAVPGFVDARNRASGPTYYFPTQESLELAEYLVKRFVEHARGAGKVPVVLLLYGQPELELMDANARRDEHVLNFLKQAGLHVVDSGAYIRTHRAEFPSYRSLVVPDGHLNRLGNRLVADALSEALQRLGLLEVRDDSRSQP